MTNNVIRAVYAYRYDGKVENLKIEKGKAIDLKRGPLKNFQYLRRGKETLYTEYFK